MKLIHIAVVLVVLLAYNACSLRTHERAGAFIGYNEHDSAGKPLVLLLLLLLSEMMYHYLGLDTLHVTGL